LQNEGLHILDYSPNITEMMKSKKIRWVWHAAHMGEMKMHNNFGRKYERKEQFGRYRRRWEDNIKRDLKRNGCEV
jgi:hypothetical protein